MAAIRVTAVILTLLFGLKAVFAAAALATDLPSYSVATQGMGIIIQLTSAVLVGLIFKDMSHG